MVGNRACVSCGASNAGSKCMFHGFIEGCPNRRQTSKSFG